jgi:hypothetical protein
VGRKPGLLTDGSTAGIIGFPHGLWPTHCRRGTPSHELRSSALIPPANGSAPCEMPQVRPGIQGFARPAIRGPLGITVRRRHRASSSEDGWRTVGTSPMGAVTEVALRERTWIRRTSFSCGSITPVGVRIMSHCNAGAQDKEERRMSELLLAAEREAVASASRHLAAEGLVIGTAGNISARQGDLIAVTPTGSDLATVTSEMVTPPHLKCRFTLGSTRRRMPLQ